MWSRVGDTVWSSSWCGAGSSGLHWNDPGIKSNISDLLITLHAILKTELEPFFGMKFLRIWIYSSSLESSWNHAPPSIPEVQYLLENLQVEDTPVAVTLLGIGSVLRVSHRGLLGTFHTVRETMVPESKRCQRPPGAILLPLHHPPGKMVVENLRAQSWSFGCSVSCTTFVNFVLGNTLYLLR